MGLFPWAIVPAKPGNHGFPGQIVTKIYYIIRNIAIYTPQKLFLLAFST